MLDQVSTNVLIKFWSIVDGRLIESQSSVSVEGIDLDSTMNVLNMHDPQSFYLVCKNLEDILQ